MNLGNGLVEQCADVLLQHSHALQTSEFDPRQFLAGQEPEFLREFLKNVSQTRNNPETKECFNSLLGFTAEIFMIALIRQSIAQTLLDTSPINVTRRSPLPLSPRHSVKRHRAHQIKIIDNEHPKDIIGEFELGIQQEQTILFLDATINKKQISNKDEGPFIRLRETLANDQEGYKLRKMHVLFTDVTREPIFREKKPGVHVLKLALLSQVRKLLAHYAPDIPQPGSDLL
jgi:hypothetical protein